MEQKEKIQCFLQFYTIFSSPDEKRSVFLRRFHSDRLPALFRSWFFWRRHPHVHVSSLQLVQPLLKWPCSVSSVCSRLVLQEVLDTDLSNEAFPFSSHKVVSAAGHQVGLQTDTVVKTFATKGRINVAFGVLTDLMTLEKNIFLKPNMKQKSYK